jgi:hypothetical protein
MAIKASVKRRLAADTACSGVSGKVKDLIVRSPIRARVNARRIGHMTTHRLHASDPRWL